MALMVPFSPIITKRTSGHIFTPTPWCSRKQHLDKISKIIGDGKSIRRDSSVDDYYLQYFIEKRNEGIFECKIIRKFTSLFFL